MQKINLRSPINRLGFGRVGINVLKALDRVCDITYFPIGQPSCVTKEEAEVIQKCIQKQENFDGEAPSLNIWHEGQLHERIGRGLNTAYSFFEINKFNRRQINSLNSLDIFFAPSKWAAGVLEDNNVKTKTVVCPVGVNREIFKPIERKQKDDTYRFFTLSKIEIRKAYDILHELFGKAFTKTSNVELLISWDNPFLSPQDIQKWESFYKNSKLGDKIHFVKLNTDEDVASYMNYCDCGLFLSRAEGAYLPLLECLSVGKPAICLGYSGHTEFISPQNSYIVDIDNLEPANDGGIWFHSTDLESGGWAAIESKQEDQIIEYMRYCFNDNIRENPGGIDTATNFSWDKTASIIQESLR